MKISLCEILAGEIVSANHMEDSTLESLVEQFEAAGEEGALWQIYFSMRLHKQAVAGDANASQALSLLRAKTTGSQRLELKEETRRHFGEILDSLPLCWNGVQNQTNYMRQIFYPEWIIERKPSREFPLLCLAPDGETKLEVLIGQVIRENNSQPSLNTESEDDMDALARHSELLDQQFMAGCRAKLAGGACLDRAEQRRFCRSFGEKLNAFLVFDRRGKQAGMSGLRACCEKYLRDEPLEPYSFTDAAWVRRLSTEATKPVSVDDDQSGRIADSIAHIQSQFEAGEYEFSANDKISPNADYSLSYCLNGIDAVLNPVYFCFAGAERCENVGAKLFSNLALALPEPGIVAWPMLVAYAVARMDLHKHLHSILKANAHEMESLASWIVIELVQAGRADEAVDWVTGKGAADALAVGDKEAFDRANCLIEALKREREYTYGGIFNYLCARLPELLPEKAIRQRSLDSLEKTALADLFWQDPNQHQAESLIALAGTMLRCGEFGRARSLLQRLFEKYRVSKDAEWEKVRSAFLDAACFWYLNGNPDRMIAVLGQYLAMRWCGADVANAIIA